MPRVVGGWAFSYGRGTRVTGVEDWGGLGLGALQRVPHPILHRQAESCLSTGKICAEGPGGRTSAPSVLFNPAEQIA